MTLPVFLDVETTGLNPTHHRVFEIALIDGETRHHWWLDVDLSTADPNALRVNRYYERVQRIEDADVVAGEVARLTSGRQLVAFNPGFDAGFLDALLREHSLVPAWDYHFVALESMCAGYLLRAADDEPDTEKAEAMRGVATPPWTSALLSLMVGVDKSQFEAHTAMGDALWHQAVYTALTTPKSAQPAPKRSRAAKAAPERVEPEPPGQESTSPPAARVGGMVRQATSPEPEPKIVSGLDHLREEAEPADASNGPSLLPPGMPGPTGDDYECRECGEEITRKQAIKTWTRFREILCPDDFKTWSPGAAR